MGLISGAVSTAATSGVVAQAEAFKTANPWQKGAETQNAKSAQDRAKSVFDLTMDRVGSLKDASAAISTNAQNEINQATQTATSALESAQQAFQESMQANIDLMAQYTEKMLALQEKRQGIADQIKEKGGEVSEAPQQPAGEQQVVQVVTTEVPQSGGSGQAEGTNNQPQTQTQTQTVTQVVTAKTEGGGEGDSAELQALQEQLSATDAEMTTVSAEMLATKAENVAEATLTLVTTKTEIVSTHTQTATSAKTSAETEIASTRQGIASAQALADTQLSIISTDQTALEAKNTATSTAASAESETCKTAASTADAQDPNKTKLESLATEFENMSTDLGQSGAAGQNKLATTNANQISQNIGNACQHAINNDLQGYTRSINEVFSQALLQVNQLAGQIQGGAEGQSAESPVPGATQGSENAGGNSAFENALTSGAGDLMAGLLGGSGDIAGAILKGVGDVIPSLFG